MDQLLSALRHHCRKIFVFLANWVSRKDLTSVDPTFGSRNDDNFSSAHKRLKISVHIIRPLNYAFVFFVGIETRFLCRHFLPREYLNNQVWIRLAMVFLVIGKFLILSLVFKWAPKVNQPLRSLARCILQSGTWISRGCQFKSALPYMDSEFRTLRWLCASSQHHLTRLEAILFLKSTR